VQLHPPMPPPTMDHRPPPRPAGGSHCRMLALGITWGGLVVGVAVTGATGRANFELRVLGSPPRTPAWECRTGGGGGGARRAAALPGYTFVSLARGDTPDLFYCESPLILDTYLRPKA
jgi:hypothetical protein